MQRFFGGGDGREEGGRGVAGKMAGMGAKMGGMEGRQAGGEGEMGALGIATRHATSLQTPEIPPRANTRSRYVYDGWYTFMVAEGGGIFAWRSHRPHSRRW